MFNNQQEIRQQVIALANQIESNHFASYDYFDFWATGWGRKAKQFAYKTEPLGHLFFSLPIMVCELWLPFLRKPMGIKKRIAPIVVAQHGLACIELFKNTGDEKWLDTAKNNAELLVSLAVPDAKGLCWGFPFSWSANCGIIPSGLPAATQSAYGFDLFEQLWRITRQDVYLKDILSVARAMDEEYIDIMRPVGIANTYHGRGHGDVVMNAIAYRIHILSRASTYGIKKYREKAIELVNYVLSRQQPDGSWMYGESEKNQFIDHYHTCFVIKNLIKTREVLNIPELTLAFQRGLDFYWNNLMDVKGLPKPFAKTVRFNIVKYELYDFAECLGLFALIGSEHGFTNEHLNYILAQLFALFIGTGKKDYFRKYRLPSINSYSYYRGSISATLLAMAQLLTLLTPSKN